MWFLGIQLIVAALLALFLFVGHRQRVRRRAASRQWTGRAFEVSAVAGRIQRLRQDYVTEAHSHPGQSSRRRALLAMTRRVVGRLSYFRKTETQHPDAGEHGSQTHAA